VKVINHSGAEAMTDLVSKVVAITGASSGIGLATARLLTSRGAKLVLGARRASRLESVTETIKAEGGDAIACALDVRRRADVAAFVATALERFGRLDVFVNNAGIGPISALDDLRVDDWEEMIDVNLKGPLYGIAEALPVFRRQKSGHFVNVVSTAGLVILPQMAVYAGTKNALRTIAEGLRLESGPDLRITNISPGFVRTDFASSMTDPAVRSAIEERMRDIGLSPDAIARAIAFAIEQPAEVEVGDIVVRPTAQG
jgi:NADP-dependent 3-hydroxy acid dehydrogenase YdfG